MKIPGLTTGMKPMGTGMMRTPRPALGMPGLMRGSLPGLQRNTTMPTLQGSRPDLVRSLVMNSLKPR